MRGTSNSSAFCFSFYKKHDINEKEEDQGPQELWKWAENIMSIAFVVYAWSGAVVTTLIVFARSVRKRVALIVLPVSAQYVTDQEESTIRSAFALNVAGQASHSEEFPAPKFHY